METSVHSLVQQITFSYLEFLPYFIFFQKTIVVRTGVHQDKNRPRLSHTNTYSDGKVARLKNFTMKFPLAVLSLLSFSIAEFINDSPPQSPCQPSSIPHLSDIAQFSILQEHKNLIHLKEPRLIIYVQTFETPDGKPLSLLPLLENKTKVTHVILASIHLHEKPGIIKLNDDLFDSPHWDSIWHEVETLQNHGIKVMGLLGGAAKGTYVNLNGTEREVSCEASRDATYKILADN